MLDAVRGEGAVCTTVTAQPGYRSVTEFTDGLVQRGLSLQDAGADTTPEALRRFDWLKSNLGIDHFEGRTWQGWHRHVCRVFTAYHFLAGERPTGELPLFSSAG